ncbi:hypothetical protein ACJ6WF_00935 [Streptomyces sp. MMS24-I2-30]|uniref:hypothetical protein n=1 Tax=Streptomyces sp. MMS24-I2-30 TaxID=3351564 RepID=UPI003896B108
MGLRARHPGKRESVADLDPQALGRRDRTVQAVTATRYRYRGNTIATPWTRLSHA